jgi:hypothetical protein
MLAAVSVSGASSVKLAAFGPVPTETVPALVKAPSTVRLLPPSGSGPGGSKVSRPSALTSTVPRTVLSPASTNVIADESVIDAIVNGASTIGLPSATTTLDVEVGAPALQSEAVVQGSPFCSASIQVSVFAIPMSPSCRDATLAGSRGFPPRPPS